MVHAAYVWVDDDRDLDRAAQRLSKASALAVDTEADSFYHYHHKCCLIQVSDGETVYLVDPLALKRLEPLGEVLGASRIVKVLHAAEQDVLYLRRDFGFHLEPLFDTMIASQLLGKTGIGLASLLLAYFGVKLDKGSQRDDWSRRPLNERQRAYASEDVRHLIRLRDVLKDELTPLVRRRIGSDVLEAVRAGLLVTETDLPAPPRGRPRKKTSAMQNRLERLREWRKTRAAELGLEPGVLFPQSTLEALAAVGPQALERPEEIPGLRAWRGGLIRLGAPPLLG